MFTLEITLIDEQVFTVYLVEGDNAFTVSLSETEG